jgi:PAS domain S-box-containing protein
MKKIVPSLAVLFLSSSLTAIVSLAIFNQQLIGIVSVIVALTSAILLFFVLKRSIRLLVLGSNNILNIDAKQGVGGFINSFNSLNHNHQQISKKFKTALHLINGLTHPEKIDPLTQLGKNDPLGMALQHLKTEMVKIKDEDSKRNWITEGLARFAAVLKQKSDLNDLGKDIISSLVKYLEVNQGGLFIHGKDEQGDEYLDLLACYAYGKQKILQRRIPAGQGMIGQCMFEKDFVIVTDIPKDYVKITSGLGESTPRNIVVAPLIFNDIFCGAIELASFEVMQPHQIEFIKKVCTNIAAELVSLKNVTQTKKLLSESNMLTLELQQREHEMKNNIETLASTQEQMTRKQAELNGYLASVNNTIACAEFNMDSTFKSGNEIFLKVMGYQEIELVNKSFGFFMGEDPSVVMMWENLQLGTFFSGEFRMKSKAGRELWLSGTFTPIVITGKLPEKIILLAQFITQEKEKLSDLNALVNALKSTLPIMEFNENFICKTANEKALQLFGLSRLLLRNKTIVDFMSLPCKEKFDDVKRKILSAEFSSCVLQFECENQILNYEVSISLVRNHEGKVTKVIMLFVRLVNDWVPALTGE